MLGLTAPVMAQTPSITPSEVDEVIFPGGSFEIEKIIQTPAIAPKPDILFLADTTGSMADAIANVKANATAIMNSVLAEAPDARFGVANYKDYQYPTQYDPYVTLWQLQMTNDTTAVQTAIDAWSASGGSDGSEGWFASLDRAANPAAPGNPGWRADSTKIIVIFGDAPAHDPIPVALTGLGYDVTETTVTDDLIAGDIKLVAVSLSTGFYAAGLDDDPLLDNYDYPVSPAQTGTPGQASRIAAATGGIYLFAPSPENVADAILEGLTSLPVTVSMTSDCDGYITTSFEPAEQVVTSGDLAYFTETITVAPETPGGIYECKDWVLIDGEPMVDESGAVIYEEKTIRVPEGFLTGGGQIVDGKGKNALKVTYAGNVGFMADFSLAGEWNVNLQNVDVDDLDKAHFKSTQITTLQFYADDLGGPEPPPASANIAFFTADGTLNGEEGWKLRFAVVDRGEPGVDDSIAFSLWEPGGTMVYYQADEFPHDWIWFEAPMGTNVTTRAAGNLQIHSGVKVD